MRPPEHHKWRATDMSDKLDIEHAAARAPQSTTSGGQQICQTSLTLSTRPPEHHKWRLADMSYKLDIEHTATRAPQVASTRPPEHHKRRATDMSDKLHIENDSPEHHKWRATDMSDKLLIEYAATRAPQVAGNRYVRQASHRARGHQSTTSGGQQICQTSFS
ncbi:hypothetical protein RRG08_059869 [Elysia crispata]|uniref:Uncharacterized protein n=1 Tax=Elysia crispata TaxID=231223 RepID=A0AAE1B2K1_9GAST|nr:hypothetical protein RRG08_059869 [Elysia crispata]